ncbi:MAG TPA: type II toxin-antitoxin system VapC family toxin [Anaerolineae bacterium]|nr:type II toxin-antitoxin system VapC family toxin [Anaerolineae bacterium]
MARRPRVFDSWALMAFLEDEPSAEKVEELIAKAQDAEAPLLITTVNLGEIWYSLARSRSESDADTAVAHLVRLGFEVIDADWELARQAAAFKARFKLAYADCFAAALAKLKRSEVVTGDREFKQLEDEVKIYWV